ncbi:MAG: FHA domain-containing protein [Planctomycetes bacterium]|nr:FHA domain-containing protein [Planctomycetota bacterium]
MLKLQITDSGGVSRELDFAEFPVRIGREDSSDIVTGDSKTSRRHAVIELDEGSLYICDQGSSNGCFLNSARVEREKLGPGDKLRLGNTRFEIREIDGHCPHDAP